MSATTPASRRARAFDSGWYGYVDKDLRSCSASGRAALQPRLLRQGNLEACRTSLWAAVQQAAELLA